ncbi:MAG: RNA-directed DNA polymerase [Bacteroidales bacterium]|jgi:RNA-directed DNA polymerase|nr:RNA-directed DNA polymerase [Bacteroidales bacterium]
MDLFYEPRLRDALFRAYFDARKNKRNTINALNFELDLEGNLRRLYEDIMYGTYTISPSICFIVEKPVKREIFAANFRDRVVHHYVINQLMDIFENQFIYDSYSCRAGKGNLFGILRLQKFIRSCTDNYRRDAYILKLDIRGFFMNIDKRHLCDRIMNLVLRKYDGWDREILLPLIRQIVMNDPTTGCIVKGHLSDWDGLPPSKSLFRTGDGCGLPIGNLTSQIFANYYLSDFDRHMKEDLKLKYYGRYVDDFFVVHRDMEFLRSLIPHVRAYLKETIGATLHPDKVYLQSCYKGVSFLGAYIAPFRTYPARRTQGNFREAVNDIARRCPDLDDIVPKEEMKLAEARLNSYLGVCGHYRAFRLCDRMLAGIPERFVKRFEVDELYRKVLWSELPQ